MLEPPADRRRAAQQNDTTPMAVTQEKPLNGGGSQEPQRRRIPPDPSNRCLRAALPGAWRRCLAGGLGLAISIILVVGGGPPLGGAALAWTLPGRGDASSAASRARPTDRTSPGAASGLQEVSAPIAVQQLGEALAQRQPRLSILEPADGASLPDGPWALRLQVEDWPLVDAGSLGLGPHLLIQLDDGPALPVVQTSLAMPPLSPGSHRLTVMAARPWGEVVKRPGAFQQIRLERIAANPIRQPAPGSPQLLATAPLGASPADPVLLDWLLIDAPLQNLRADDARWRLRVSVNGDSFLVDQATPLWLKGWRRGSNALMLELVDGRGEPLNPPFNSLVREVRLQADGPRPAWLNGLLSERDLARLLGQGTPEPEEPEEPEPMLIPQPPAGAALDRPAPSSSAAAPDPGATDGSQELAERAEVAAEPPGSAAMAAGDAQPDSEGEAETRPAPVETAGQPPDPEQPEEGPAEAEPILVEAQKALPADQQEEEQQQGQEHAAEHEQGQQEPEPALAQSPVQAPPSAPDPGAAPIDPELAGPAPAGGASSPEPPPLPLPSQRPSAREEVRPDGTLIRPARSGALQALRERLHR